MGNILFGGDPVSQAIIANTVDQFKSQSRECDFVVVPSAEHANITVADLDAQVDHPNAAVSTSSSTSGSDSGAASDSGGESDTDSSADTVSDQDNVVIIGAVSDTDAILAAAQDIRPRTRVHSFLAKKFSAYATRICGYSAQEHELPFSPTTINNLAGMLYGTSMQLTPGSLHEMVTALDYIEATYQPDILVDHFMDMARTPALREHIETIMLYMFDDDYVGYKPMRGVYAKIVSELIVTRSNSAANAPTGVYAPTLHSHEILVAMIGPLVREHIDAQYHPMIGDKPKKVYRECMCKFDVNWMTMMNELDSDDILYLLRGRHADISWIKKLNNAVNAKYKEFLEAANTVNGVQIVAMSLSNTSENDPQFVRTRLIKTQIIGFARWFDGENLCEQGSFEVRKDGIVAAAKRCRELFGEPPTELMREARVKSREIEHRFGSRWSEPMDWPTENLPYPTHESCMDPTMREYMLNRIDTEMVCGRFEPDSEGYYS